MGVGDDSWTPWFIETFRECSVVDASRTLLDSLKSKYEGKVNTYDSLFEEFTPPCKYDSVVASHILEHVDEPVTVLRQAATWIKPDGRIFIIVPNAGSLHRRVGVLMGVQKFLEELSPNDLKLGHRRVYAVETLEADILASGLQIIRRRGLFIKFLPQGMMTSFSDELLRGFMAMSETMPIEYSSRLAYECALKA